MWHEQSGASFATRDKDGYLILSDFKSKVVATIEEDHHPSKIEDIEDSMAVIDSTTKEVSTLAIGRGFYAFLALV
jgi:hypothetical protein